MRSIGLIDRLKIRFRPYVCPFNLLLPFIEPGLRYCDIGCGSGTFLRIVAEHKKPLALAGIEVSGQLIDNAALVLTGCTAPLVLRTYNGCDVPTDIDTYDYLFLIDVLHHLPRDVQFGFLGSLFARMKPGQRLLLKDIDADSRLVYWNKLHDLVISKQIGYERRPSVVKEHLERIGFQVQLCFTKRVFLYPHYALLCTKS